jgi:hypothetical protein
VLPTKLLLSSVVFPPPLDDDELDPEDEEEEEEEDKLDADDVCRPWGLPFWKYFCECVRTCSAVLVFSTPAINRQLFPNL